MAKAWFEPKSHGYGAGLPIAWQGWALLASYMGLTVGAALLFLPARPLLFFTVVTTATLVFVRIVKRRTRGGFRWRWGPYS